MMGNLQQPESVSKQHKALLALMNKDDKAYLTVEDVAKYLGMGHETLRRLLYSNACPFGMGLPGSEYENSYSKISKLAFWNWVMKGTDNTWAAQ